MLDTDPAPENETDAEILAVLRPLLLDPATLRRAIGSGRRRGRAPAWRRVELRPVRLKGGPRLQVVRYDERHAHTANYPIEPDAVSPVVDALLAEPFGSWHVRTTSETVQLRVTKRGRVQVHHDRHDDHPPADAGPPAPDPAPDPRPDPLPGRDLLAHDRPKPHLLDPADPVLVELGISTREGRVKPTRQDKYRQVEEFLRALDPVLEPLGDTGRPLRVVDLGCGNAYLTFAAYRHLTASRPDRRGLDVELTGVDVRPGARAHNTALAERLGWAGSMRFVEATIADADLPAPDIVLALHACDTATDDALARAVRWQAPVVLAAPCCHHDIQAQLRAGRPPAPYAPLTRHGILRERFADVLTDALRAAILRLAGYRVEVIEFVASEHTPRNVLLRAVRTGAPATEDLRADYRGLTEAWGVRPRLATLLGLDADA